MESDSRNRLVQSQDLHTSVGKNKGEKGVMTGASRYSQRKIVLPNDESEKDAGHTAQTLINHVIKDETKISRDTTNFHFWNMIDYIYSLGKPEEAEYTRVSNDEPDFRMSTRFVDRQDVTLQSPEMVDDKELIAICPSVNSTDSEVEREFYMTRFDRTPMPSSDHNHIVSIMAINANDNGCLPDFYVLILTLLFGGFNHRINMNCMYEVWARVFLHCYKYLFNSDVLCSLFWAFEDWFKGLDCILGDVLPAFQTKAVRSHFRRAMREGGRGRSSVMSGYSMFAAWAAFSLIPLTSAFCTSGDPTDCFEHCDKRDGITFSAGLKGCDIISNHVFKEYISNNETGHEMIICESKTNESDTDLCMSNCLIGGDDCDGDSKYCKENRCSTDSFCFCKLKKVRERKLNMTKDVKLVWKSMVAESQERGDGLKRNVLEDDLSVEMYCSMSAENVTVEFSRSQSGEIVIRKDAWTKSLSFMNSSSLNIAVSRQAFMLGGLMYVDYFEGGKWKNGCQSKLPQRVNCEFYDCILCYQSYETFLCMPFAHKSLVSVTWVALALAIVALSPWLIIVALFVLNMALLPLRIVFFSLQSLWHWERMRVLRSKAYTSVAPTYGLNNVDVEPRNDEEDFNRRFRAAGYRPNAAMMVIMFCCLCVPISAQNCVEGVTIPSSSVICTTDGTSSTCSVTINQFVSLPFPTASYCASIVNEHGVALGNLTVTLVEVIEKVSLRALYYTSGWEGVATTTKRCRNAGSCTGTKCANMTEAGITAYGELKNNVALSWPGVTSCEASPGCAGCGCFLCSDGCQFWRWALVPQGSIFRVAAPDVATRVPKVRVLLNNKLLSETTISGIYTTNGNWSFTMVGSLAGDTVLFGNNKIMTAGGHPGRFGAASDNNIPIAGSLGDIQGVSREIFGSPNVNAFLIDKSIGTVTLSGCDEIRVTFRQQGTLSLPVYQTFPAVIGGRVWNLETASSLMWNNVTNPGAVLFNLKSLSKIVFNQVINVVCPEIGVQNVTACSTCTMGGIITVELRSTCQPGLVAFHLNTPNARVTTTSVGITTESAFYEVRFITDVVQNDYNLIVIGTRKNATIRLQFEAKENITLRNDTDTETNDESDGGSGSSGFSLKKPQNWYSWLVWAIIIICIVGGILLMIPLARAAMTRHGSAVSSGLKSARAKTQNMLSEMRRISNKMRRTVV